MAKRNKPQPPGQDPAISPDRLNLALATKELERALAQLDEESQRDFVSLASALGESQIAKSRAGWASATVGGQAEFKLGYDLPDKTREYLVQQSRASAPINRIAGQILKLWVAFTVGQGIRPTLGDDAAVPAPDPATGPSSDPTSQSRGRLDRRKSRDKVRSAVDSLWNSAVNFRTLSPFGIGRSAYRAAIDGELFYVVVEPAKSQDGVPIRQIQALEVVSILSNPEDSDDIWYYLCRKGEKKFSLYPDWTRRNLQKGMIWGGDYAKDLNLTGELSDNIKLAGVPKWGYWTLHFPRETAGKRGRGILFAALPWIQEFRSFMVNRMGVQKAIHRWALKAIAAGADSTTLASLKSYLQSSIVTGDSTIAETNPAPAAGSVWAQNSGIDMKPMGSFETGADAAQIDGGMLLQSASSMFPPHWMGDAASFRLATATALEMPLRAMLEMDQNYWRSVYRTLTSFALEVSRNIKREDSEILIKFPALNNRQVAAFITAYANLITAAPAVAEEPEAWGGIAAELSVEDQDTFAANLAAKSALKNASDLEIKKKQAEKPPPAPGARGAPGSPNSGKPGATRSDKSGKRGERTSDPKPARSKEAPQ